MKFGYVKKEKVEPMTLKAFVREQVEGGKKHPFDLFGVYIANKTKITNKYHTGLQNKTNCIVSLTNNNSHL